MRLVLFISSFGLLLACAPDPLTKTSLPFFGGGYRADGDQCRRLGESAATAEYLDHTADLVGCPEAMENLGVFVTETDAIEVFRQDGYIVYSVPNGG
ncbi:hypothetical protein [Roseobacter weihaiensis]|uniref:hypothetical protein n=1 Tax=Roseobacter weihaiensis TaxID=2763262 RepID=UPI001D0B1985|nr:hypothetical protein [Roseobacter sp. H9]